MNKKERGQRSTLCIYEDAWEKDRMKDKVLALSEKVRKIYNSIRRTK